jgi:hypothetical protein
MAGSNNEVHENIVLTTYPRSGSNFFREAFFLATGVHIDRTHDITKKNHEYTINISRDPMECMASWISMQRYFNEAPLSNDHYIKFVCIPNYLKFQSHIISRANFIINYLDLQSKPDVVIKDIANKTSTPLIMEDISMSKIEEMLINIENRRDGYLKTSLKSEQYQLVMEDLQKYNLDECYNLYYKSIDRSIVYG